MVLSKFINKYSPTTTSYTKMNNIACFAGNTILTFRRILLPTVLVAVLLFTCPGNSEVSNNGLSIAYPDYLETSAGKFFRELEVKHPGKSGFILLRNGRKAFTVRIAMSELAEKSLDVQYYIWQTDTTGRIFAERLIKAADRGVKVRILVDDISLGGKDSLVAMMDAHPNIKIKIFNPFGSRKSRILDYIVDLGRINHRMHNKLMVMDNSVVVVGGRNIGDNYFGIDPDANFRDLDICAAGPVVRDTSKVFDHFWNGTWSVPITSLAEQTYSGEDISSLLVEIQKHLAEARYPYPIDQDIEELKTELTGIREQLIWAPGRIVWDDPASIKDGISGGKLIKGFYNSIKSLNKELLIESAYFVTQDDAIDKMKGLKDRNVRVRVLTNSLASNDVLAAHAGHAKRRKQLVENGMELYEFRPDAGSVKQQVNDKSPKTSLHTKAVVFDRKAVFIGSFNLDPRSANINTEAGLYVESPDMAEQLAAYMDGGVQLSNSYRVYVGDSGELQWSTESNGDMVQYHKDPESTFLQRLLSRIIMMLPVEKQL